MRGRSRHQHAHAGHLARSPDRLLSEGRERPCSRRAAEQCDERAPVHCLVAPVLYSSTERIARGETVALRDLDSANVGSGSIATDEVEVTRSRMSASPLKADY